MPAATTDISLFSVTCNRTVYFKQGAYDMYDGRNWHLSPKIPRQSLVHEPNGTYGLKDIASLSLPIAVPAIRLEQKYHMIKNLGERLIFAGNPAEITYPGPSIVADACGNLKGGWIQVRGSEYTVASDDPLYDLKSMREEGLPEEEEEARLRRALSIFIQIPNSQSARTYDLSKSVAGLQDNWFSQAEKICNYLKKNYKYSTDPKYKTKSKNNVDRFLFKTKTGDCKDFASAFVILSRCSGIPARMVVGYTPGDFDPATGNREIKLKHAHAWGEIYVPSAGWVPFDSTPHGIMPARRNEEERYFKSLGEKVESSFKKVQVQAQGGAKGESVQVVQIPITGVGTITINPMALFKWLPVGIGLVILSGPIFMFFRDIKSRIRWPKPMLPASKVYCKLVKDLKPLGVASPESQTPGEFLKNLQAKLSESSELEQADNLSSAVEEFVYSYNATCFGGKGSVKELEQKRQKVQSLIKPFKK